VRPERLELPAYWFEASRSIQLSYGRTFPIIPTPDTPARQMLSCPRHPMLIQETIR
jgi:hypothetical protein